jgi:hypothetical protein
MPMKRKPMGPDALQSVIAKLSGKTVQSAKLYRVFVERTFHNRAATQIGPIKGVQYGKANE